MTRINELLRREIAEGLYKIVNDKGFDFAAVTVTHVVTSPDLRHARILVSIREHEDDRQHILNQLSRHRKDLQQAIRKHLHIKYTPRLSFEIDESIAEGDRVLDLISQIEHEEETDDDGAESE
ncbi:MAG: 30S ribosome-binding factor RbfA [Verrucomicrobia bacterium]|nr:30S ribosome-binding factor RbfA [Verrucomicrobiota bacterium]